MKVKALKIDHEYYLYPEGYPELHQMGAYLNTTESRFVHLVQLLDDNCVEPYFIESEQTDCYLNVSRMEKLRESEVTILSKEEYDQRLVECIARTCKDCVHYIDDQKGDNLEGHRNKLSLDGNCFFKEPVEEKDTMF